MFILSMEKTANFSQSSLVNIAFCPNFVKTLQKRQPLFSVFKRKHCLGLHVLLIFDENLFGTKYVSICVDLLPNNIYYTYLSYTFKRLNFQKNSNFN